MSNLLINEPPLQVLPSLAKSIGLNEAIVLQQLHYWLRHAKVEHDGKMWIYKNFDKWKEQDFDFWSINTIRRAVKSLSDQNLIMVEKLARNSFDRVNHYTINYEELEKLDVKSTLKPITTQQPNMGASNNPERAEQQPNMGASEQPNMGASLREQEETNEETNEENVSDVFNRIYNDLKMQLVISGIIPVGKLANDDELKPEIYTYLSWCDRKGFKDHERLSSVIGFFKKKPFDDRKRYYTKYDDANRNYFNQDDYENSVPVSDERAAEIRAQYSDVLAGVRF